MSYKILKTFTSVKLTADYNLAFASPPMMFVFVWETHHICNSASVSREPVPPDEGHGIGEGKRTTGRHKVPICQHGLHAA